MIYIRSTKVPINHPPQVPMLLCLWYQGIQVGCGYLSLVRKKLVVVSPLVFCLAGWTVHVADFVLSFLRVANPANCLAQLELHPCRNAEQLALHPCRNAEQLALHPCRNAEQLALHPCRTEEQLLWCSYCHTPSVYKQFVTHYFSSVAC